MKHIKLTACPCGADHAPSIMQMGDHFWIECPQCGRESFAVGTESEATSAWSSDVGSKGRSNLIANIKANAAQTSALAI